MELEHCNAEKLRESIHKQAIEHYDRKEAELNPIFEAIVNTGRVFGPSSLRGVEKHIMLETLDKLWREHLLSMDHLKGRYWAQGYAQKNPSLSIKEGFDLFSIMIFRMKEKFWKHYFMPRLIKVHLKLWSISRNRKDYSRSSNSNRWWNTEGCGGRA